MNLDIILWTVGILFLLSCLNHPSIKKYLTDYDCAFAMMSREDIADFGFSFSWGGRWDCGSVAFKINFINLTFMIIPRRCCCERKTEQKEVEDE